MRKLSNKLGFKRRLMRRNRGREIMRPLGRSKGRGKIKINRRAR
jgi:hypothetical protein